MTKTERAWVRAANDFCAWLAASDAPEATRRLRRYQLYRIGRDIGRDPWKVSERDLVQWLATHEWGRETRRSFRACIRVFYRWAVSNGYIDSDPSAGLPRVPPAIHVPRPAPEDAIERALRNAAPRERLMIMLGARLGLRRKEIAAIHADDIIDGGLLMVHGKGGKPRVLPLTPELFGELKARGPGYVFPGPQGHLSADHVGKLISRSLPPGVTAHQLRHRFGTVAYRKTHDLYGVQRALGHSRPETTAGYVKLDHEALASVVAAAA